MFIEGILRESRGNVWPTTLLARCSGLHNKGAEGKPEVFRCGGSCVSTSRRERHNLTADARLICELRQSEQNRSTSSQGPVVFKQSPDTSVPQYGDCAEIRMGECGMPTETFCILTSFLHERRL